MHRRHALVFGAAVALAAVCAIPPAAAGVVAAAPEPELELFASLPGAAISHEPCASAQGCGCCKHRSKKKPADAPDARPRSTTNIRGASASCCHKKKAEPEMDGMDMGGAAAEEDDGPGMNMYFTDAMPFYLLFKFWVPSTPGQYWFAVFMMLAAGVVYEGLKTMMAQLEFRWAAQRRKGSCALHDLIRAGLTFVSTVLSYALMLAAMCFNTGIFFAVCGGFALGVLIFGRYKPYSPLNERDCCAG